MAVREIVFDTETTGLSPDNGDRMIEIGCVELIDHKPTGREYHAFYNPEGKEISEGAYNVHKISNDFLSDKPYFKDKVDEFLEFIGTDSVLVAHNGTFDMRFINAELERIDYPIIPATRLLDTLWLARRKVSDIKRYTLDALCDYFEIDRSERDDKGHGALLDSQILAEVYYELIVDKEQKLLDDDDNEGSQKMVELSEKEFRPTRQFKTPQSDLDNHQKFLEQLKEPLWLKQTEE